MAHAGHTINVDAMACVPIAFPGANKAREECGVRIGGAASDEVTEGETLVGVRQQDRGRGFWKPAPRDCSGSAE